MAAYQDTKKAKGQALMDLSHLMKNTEKRSLPGGKITPGDVDSVQVSRKPTQGSKNFEMTGKSGGTTKVKTATPQVHDYPEGKEKETSEAEPPDFEDSAEEKGETFQTAKANPGDKNQMDAKEIDRTLKSFLLKTKKHKSSF